MSSNAAQLEAEKYIGKRALPPKNNKIMNFLISKFSSEPNLLFKIGSIISERNSSFSSSMWNHYSGELLADKQPVSVFVFDIKKNPERLPLARNALRRAKTIRYPDCVRYIDGVETDSQIIIGTEPVVTLHSHLFNELDLNLAKLGILKVATTLRFLAVDCNMVHGNVGVDSVFVTRSGEWKLGGFEVLTAKNEEPDFLSLYGYLLSKGRFIAPELERGGSVVPTPAVDAYGLGCLIYSVFNGSIRNQSDFDQCGKIPQPLFRHYKSLLVGNSSSRLDIDSFLKATKSYFDDSFISTSLFLEQFSLKDKVEKEEFLITIEQSVASFPIIFCKFKILPALLQSLEFGGAGAKALKPILTIGSRLGSSDFEELVIPAIIKLFANPDRSIRLALCEKIDGFVNQLSDKICNDTIYPNLASGFLDSLPVIREQTLKAVTILAPKLQKKTINNSLLRHLAKLQIDPEPGIRTNTTICLAKLSKYFDDSLKPKVLLQAFLRSLNDSFGFARKAGLTGLMATADCFSTEDIAKKIIPHICPLCLDPEKAIRNQAFLAIESLLAKLKKSSESIPEAIATPASTSIEAFPKANGSGGWTSMLLATASGVAGRLSATESQKPATIPYEQPVRMKLTPTSSTPISKIAIADNENFFKTTDDLSSSKGKNPTSGWENDWGDNDIHDSWNTGSNDSWNTGNNNGSVKPSSKKAAPTAQPAGKPDWNSAGWDSKDW